MSKASRTRPLRLEDLKPAPWNPRTITKEALEGLKGSLDRFGDLSGLAYNACTGHLLARHRRIQALRGRYGGELRMEKGSVVTPVPASAGSASRLTFLAVSGSLAADLDHMSAGSRAWAQTKPLVG